MGQKTSNKHQDNPNDGTSQWGKESNRRIPVSEIIGYNKTRTLKSLVTLFIIHPHGFNLMTSNVMDHSMHGSQNKHN